MDPKHIVSLQTKPEIDKMSIDKKPDSGTFDKTLYKLKARAGLQINQTDSLYFFY